MGAVDSIARVANCRFIVSCLSCNERAFFHLAVCLVRETTPVSFSVSSSSVLSHLPFPPTPPLHTHIHTSFTYRKPFRMTCHVLSALKVSFFFSFSPLFLVSSRSLLVRPVFCLFLVNVSSSFAFRYSFCLYFQRCLFAQLFSQLLPTQLSNSNNKESFIDNVPLI